MPLFTNINLGVPKPLDLADYQPTFAEQVSASFEAAFQSNPMQILERRKQMAGLSEIEWEDSLLPLDAREIIDADEFADDYARHVLSLEDQARQIKEAGLEGQLKPVEGYRQEALDIVIDHKRMENALAAMNPGLGASLLGGFAAGILDPINLASSIVPVIGEARVMSMMAAAKGIGQRAMIRAGIGAASGAAGAAMLEPMIYLGQQEVQADYTLANSLQNLFIGSLMGGALHSTFGTTGEWRRARSGKPQPWEYVPPDFQTEEWKKAHAEDLFRKQMEATPEADPEIVRQWAEGEAVTFDAHARNWAYHEKKTVKEYYDKWEAEYRTWQDDSVWREAMPDELRGNASDDGDLGWIGRQYEGLRTLNADDMTLPEFLDNLKLWEERFPDLHDYAAIRQRIEDARAGRIPDSEILNQFAGERGMATADLAENGSMRMDNLAIAREMEAGGKTPLAIKLATGWEKGADGKWRYEIPDGQIKEDVQLRAKQLDEDSLYYDTTLGEIYVSDELYAAYPESRDTRVIFQKLEPGTRGKFYDGALILDKRFAERASRKNAAQIAEIEATEEFKAYEKALDETDNIEDPILAEQEFDRISDAWDNTGLGQKYNALLNDNARIVMGGKISPDARSTLVHEIQHAIQEKEGFAQGAGSKNPDYHRVAGEVEARNVQARMEFSPEERRNLLAYQTEDVPRDSQIIVFDSEKAASADEPVSKGPVAHENVNTVEDLYSAARASQPVFNDFINSVAEATGGEAHFRPGEGLKSIERVMRKIEQDYPEEGARRVIDVLGATLLYKDRAAVENAVKHINELAEKIGGKVARVKDRFKNPSAGYKDFLLNIKMPNGFVTELLMTTKAMSEAKNGKTGVGHQIYEAMQEVQGVLARKNLTEKEEIDADFIFNMLDDASRRYYDSTGVESNATASLSGIVEPLKQISARLGEREADSSEYPNVVSLLGTIFQRLPSVANTKGISSYSRNFLTNTVPPSGNVSTRIGAGIDAPVSSSNLRNSGEFSGVRDDGITHSPVDGDNINQKPVTDKNDTLLQTALSHIGNKTEILGANSKEMARYELRELEDVIPSHDPENNFKRRSDYPEIAQERPYHSDDGEQQKVVGNALGYEPGFVISTDASATNGPPIITSKGIVLGGNSRAMTLQLVYGKFPEKAAAYRKALMDNAAQFGLDPNAIASMKKPMLVRVVSGDLTPEQMAKRSREYNQTTTQQLQGEAEGISRARFVDRPTLNELAAGLKDGRTISEFLASPESADFAILLQDAGVLQQSEIASLIYPGSGKLNDAGKARVMHIMRGLVLPDYDIMTSLPKGVLNNLDASIPVLALSRMRGEGWDLTGAFYEAMRMTAEAKNKGVPIEQQFFQHTLAGSADPMRDNPAVQALALLFSKSDPKEMRMRMEHYLSLADSGGAGQNALIPGMGITPAAAFKKAFLEPLVFVGNERVPNFNPAANPRHAALAWAIEHGGKTPTIEKTLAKLEKEAGKKNVAPEEKARLAEYKKELAPLSGVVGMRKPKLGEFWKDPDKIEIPAGKKPGEKGALPEAAHIDEPVSLNDPDALLPPELQENPRPVVRGSVTFRAEDRPLVTFFQSADFSTAPHELFHIFRREMEQTALSPNASLHAREQWKRICDFVGARPDEKWTVEMEEKFANAGLRYLAEGKAPSPSLQGIFERLKAWFMELFQRVEDIGAEISPEMRKAFDGMFEVPFETADRNFRRSMGELHSREVEREFADPDTIGKPLPPDDQRLAETGGNLHDLEELTREAQIRADEVAARLERNNPELRDVIEETNAELAEIDAEIARVGERDEMRRKATECLANGG